MADEQNKQPLPPAENPTPIDPQNPPEPIREMQAKTIREIRAETEPTSRQPEGARELKADESPEARAAREAFESTLDKGIEGIEDAVNQFDRATTPRTPADALAHAVPNTTNFFGIATIPLPIYDVVFFSLAAFTVLEVLLGGLQMSGVLILVLLSLSFVKAFHVVYFYMHLKSDDRIFWLTLMIPLILGLLGIIFLLAVSPTSYT